MSWEAPPHVAALWQEADRVTARARWTGALVPLGSSVEWIADAGFRFAVQLLGGGFRAWPRAGGDLGAARNPFLPYDPELFVGDLSTTHIALLNKFPVIDRHLLVVTRVFVEQEAPLGREDFEAWWRCLPAGAGGGGALGFYNSGPEAGASQRHRHLQVVPLPIGGAATGTPFERAFAAATIAPATLPGLPFRHVAARLEPTPEPSADGGAARAHQLYRRALRALGRDPERPGPYNLLATRRFLCVVPRHREHFETVSVNALGFCGVLLAVAEDDLRLLRERGPMAALEAVAG